MNLKFKKLDLRATAPFFASEGAACFDLTSMLDNPLRILPGDARVIPTGLAFEVPEGYVMLVYSRSGHGFKSGVRLGNCVGVIDSDYRGEVMVKLVNDGSQPFDMGSRDRIAQAMLIKLPSYTLDEVQDLSDTARGTGGLGSTGA